MIRHPRCIRRHQKVVGGLSCEPVFASLRICLTLMSLQSSRQYLVYHHNTIRGYEEDFGAGLSENHLSVTFSIRASRVPMHSGNLYRMLPFMPLAQVGREHVSFCTSISLCFLTCADSNQDHPLSCLDTGRCFSVQRSTFTTQLESACTWLA